MAGKRNRGQDGAAGPTENFPIETAGELLPDGTVIELIRDGTRRARINLLVWNGAEAKVQPRFKHNGGLYLPVTLQPTSLRLPTRLGSYASTRELFDDICTLLTRFSDLPEQFVLKIAYFILGTWLADHVWLAPFLFVIAPLTSPKAVLQQLLTLLCRRPLLLGEVSLPALCSSPMNLRPTLLFDLEFTLRAQRLLRATNSRGVYFLRNDRAFDLFCAKAVFSREPPGDPLLASQALQIALAPTRRQLPVLDREVSEKIADDFQARLLRFRLTNYGKVRTPQFNVSGLTTPMQDLAHSLGAIVDDEELLCGIIPLLRDQDNQIRVERSAGLESVIVEALFYCCHDENRSEVRSGELADIVNTIWAGRSESQQTTPESVGWKLRALGLHTERIGSAGKGLRLTEAVRARVHKLARDYGVPSVQQGAKERCRHCVWSSGTGDEP